MLPGCKSIFARVDAEAAKVANEGLELLDVLVPARLAELKPDRPVGVRKRAMDLDAVLGEPLLRALDDVIREVVAEVGVNPAQTDLLQEQQQFVGRGTDVHHRRDFDVVRIVLVLGAAAASAAAPPTSGSLRKSRRGVPDFDMLITLPHQQVWRVGGVETHSGTQTGGGLGFPSRRSGAV